MATKTSDVVDVERYRDLLRRCAVSRDSRRASAQTLRQWYERGTETGVDARYNKLRSHLDRLASYLWAPEAVRFAIHLPPSSRADWLPAAQTARDEFRDLWATTGADLTVSMALEWALVYNTGVIKVQGDPQHGFVLGYIDSWDFGVTREDQQLDDQDVMAHYYTLSLPQFERWAQGHPRREDLLTIAREHASAPSGGTSMLPRLVVTGVTGVFPNSDISASFPGDPIEPAESLDPQVIEPVVQLVDLWERTVYHDDPFSDDYEDWRVTTLVGEADQWLVTRRNPVLPRVRLGPNAVLSADQPFTLLTPRPMPNYLWGRSEMAGGIKLQQWREDHMRAIGDAVNKQLDPPKFFTDVGDWEEGGRAMNTPGGSYGSPNPGARMTPLQVQVPPEAFGLTDRIDHMFEDQSGIPSVLQGEGQPGVRASNQLVALAGIGAGRVRHMALRLEAALGRIATLGFSILQRTDGQGYPLKDGNKFLLAQLPPGLSLSVSAHSASPIFAEQVQAKALQLLKAGAIDGPWLVELLDPPYREELKVVAEALAKAKAEQTEKLMQLQAAKYARTGRVK